MFSSSLSSSKKHEKGQGLVEYALILVLVAIVVIGALTILGPKVGTVFSDINNSIAGAGGGSGSNASLPDLSSSQVHYTGATQETCGTAAQYSSVNSTWGTGWGGVVGCYGN